MGNHHPDRLARHRPKIYCSDLYQTEPSTVAALAGAALALGIVFWLVRSQEYPDMMGEGQKANLPS